MAVRSRRQNGNGLEAWPGYVDALSTLLMVIIFVLLVFVLAQAFLSATLAGRNEDLDKARAELSDLRAALTLERGRTADLTRARDQAARDLAAAAQARATLSQQLDTLRDVTAKLSGERDRLTAQLGDARLAFDAASVAADRYRAALAQTEAQRDEAQRNAAALQGQVATKAQDEAAARSELAETQRRLAAAIARAETAEKNAATLRAQADDLIGQSSAAAKDEATARAELTATQRQLAAARAQLAEMQSQIATLDRTVKVDKETIEARLSELADLAQQARALQALREDLERRLRETEARLTAETGKRTATENDLAAARKLSDAARGEIALLRREIEELRTQLTTIAKALDISKAQLQDKDVTIADLGQRLNVALAERVQLLERYRSEFFGRLRSVLENRPGIQIVGDRFVFQSEVLFPRGSAELSPSGMAQMNALAETIRQIANEIPSDVNWLLRVDGHTDPQPVRGGQFASNWELSAARAITVVKLLIAAGVPPERLAATGFGEYQPFEPGDTPEAYAKDRRIELRLTDR